MKHDKMTHFFRELFEKETSEKWSLPVGESSCFRPNYAWWLEAKCLELRVKAFVLYEREYAGDKKFLRGDFKKFLGEKA